jgi:chromosome segregation ATPase
MRSLSDWE